ncbi:hypothetical protein GCM10027425_05660 [Alteromonas gracilis]
MSSGGEPNNRHERRLAPNGTIGMKTPGSIACDVPSRGEVGHGTVRTYGTHGLFLALGGRTAVTRVILGSAPD